MHVYASIYTHVYTHVCAQANSTQWASQDLSRNRSWLPVHPTHGEEQPEQVVMRRAAELPRIMQGWTDQTMQFLEPD